MLDRLRRLPVLVGLCGLLQAAAADAALGGRCPIVRADAPTAGSAAATASATAPRGSAGTSTAPLSLAGHRVVEYADASGATVREFCDATGIVFAVTWDGPSLPDMRQLLGTRFDRYRDAAAFPTTGALRTIQAADLVLSSRGRMRAFKGYAYDPALVPPSVDPTAFAK